MGPTASGKTELAVALTEALPVEIISVDSALVYRGMDIGTAKPDAEILGRAPHRLIDICEPEDTYSAARFANDARRHIEEIHQQDRVPLLVGGTMLYFRALLEGLSPLPAADAAIRQRLVEEAALQGWAALHARLERIDPIAAARIHPNDPQRLQRALEVHELTGKPISELQAVREDAVASRYRVARLALYPQDRTLLHQRIARRFDTMLEAGFVGEVERLRARKALNLALPAMKSVGYRQVWQYLDGEISYEEMREKGKVATRQLAKRQLTWLRSETGLERYDPLTLQWAEMLDKVIFEYQSFL
jgi:tRNA dimethylallyltransferase